MSDLSDLVKRYADLRATTLALAAPLSEADCTVQSMTDASPVKWHLAHTSWFFETFVLEPFACAGDVFECFDPSYRVLFNSYYNSIGEQYPRPDRGLITRPGMAQVERYRAFVDEGIARLLADPELPDEVVALVELGIQHEQQHQELVLTDLKHALSCNPNHPVYRERIDDEADRADPGLLAWRACDEGLVEIGFSGDGFSFDNERPNLTSGVSSSPIRPTRLKLNWKRVSAPLSTNSRLKPQQHP